MAKQKLPLIDMDGFISGQVDNMSIKGNGQIDGFPLCEFCARFDKRQLGNGKRFTCAAFPKGIPDDIIDWRFDHRFTHKDDGGLRFAVREGDEASFKNWMEGFMYQMGVDTPAQKIAKLAKKAKDTRRDAHEALAKQILERKNK